jgi:hypothetical protein
VKDWMIKNILPQNIDLKGNLQELNVINDVDW